MESFVKSLGGRKVLTENEVKSLLKEYNIPTTEYVLVKNEKDLKKISLPYPLVMKICSPKYTHKTDVGGVKLGIKSEDELVKVYKDFQKKFAGENFIIETMEKPGVEAIVGLVHDPTFGLSIMFGLGGIFTEIFKDVVFRVLPIDRKDAEDMMSEIKSRKILGGFRGIKVSRDALINILLNVSNLGVDFQNSIKEMDLNPVFLREKDAVVVDARMIIK
ncbi:MAG: acetyl-CoA synthetase [Euryarchaeota archaeon CG_4_9_14_3_um_filter_38_12]|nr:MAG: acetyl-CoA synthetase [Euryarchaeota archaeon CG_4_9_14_3_um_filter_38_12]